LREEAALAAAQNVGHANSRILNYPHELDNREKEIPSERERESGLLVGPD
jgi:hypothetical protein